MTIARRVSLAVVLTFLFALSFHRPPLLDAFGPAAGLPEMLFPCAVIAVLLSRWRVDRAALAPALVIAAGFAPSVLFAMDRRRAAAQLCVFLYVAGIYATTRTIARNGHRSAALLALACGAATNVAIGLAGAFLDLLSLPASDLVVRTPWTLGAPRPIGLTESANMLALVAFSGLFATLALRRLGTIKLPAAGVLTAVAALGLVACQSRIALAALLGVAALKVRHRKPLWAAIGGVSTLGMLVSIRVQVVPIQRHFPFLNMSLGPYGAMHEIALRAFLHHPLTGVGLESFLQAWPKYYDPARYDRAFSGEYATMLGRAFDPHGTLVGYLAEAGLPALPVLGALAWLVWRGRARDVPEAGAYAIGLLLASFSVDVLTERNTWALLGLLSSLSVGARSICGFSETGDSPVGESGQSPPASAGAQLAQNPASG